MTVLKALVFSLVLLLSVGCGGLGACDAGYREAATWLDTNALPQENVAVDEGVARCFGERVVQPLPATVDALALLRVVEGGQPDYVLATDGVTWDGVASQPWFLAHYRPVQTWQQAESPGAAVALYAYLPSPFDGDCVFKPPATFLTDRVVLRGYRIGSSRVGPDEPVHLTLLWDDVPGLGFEDLRVGACLVEVATGETWASSSSRLTPSGLVLDGDARLAQQVLLAPPEELPKGEYRIVVSLTEPSGRAVDVSADVSADPATVEGGMVLATVVNPPDVSESPIAMDHAVAYTFGVAAGEPQVSLLGYDTPERAAPGGAVRVALLWSAQHPLAEDYHVLVHLVSAAGELVAQGDGVPVYGFFPTSTWAPGTYVRDEHYFVLSEDLPRGDYQLYVGLYLVETGVRLSSYDVAGAAQPDGRVSLYTLAVR